VVKLYASAMFPGFFLAFLYLIYIVGWALVNPKIAPKSESTVPVSDWVPKFQTAYSRNMLVGLLRAPFAPGKAAGIEIAGRPMGYRAILGNLAAALFPLALCAVTLWGIWWYVVIHPMADVEPSRPAAVTVGKEVPPAAGAEKSEAGEEKPQELGTGLSEPSGSGAAKEAETLQEMGDPGLVRQGGGTPAQAGPPPEFFWYFWTIAVATGLLLLWYYWKMEAEQFELLKLLSSSVMPLGILTIVVLAVILFGITTATESAAIGAAGAFLMGFQAKTLNWERVKQSVFLTAKTTAMVCWLFVGSALFSGVFAILGGQQLVEQWVLSFDLTPLQFMIVSQAIIFILGWPLEWTEIIVIFVPIFLPLLKHFNIDPILWGTLVFVNLQAAFLSPPVAMSAFYLKGVAPSHVTLNQIFSGMMPYMLIVILCMVLMYVWPGMTLWLPNYLYGGG
jgi:TRAP-type mannitol/chloroaromatic compound transport system permease large subunit